VAEHAVELVQVALVLDQRGARQIVEVLDAAAGERIGEARKDA